MVRHNEVQYLSLEDFVYVGVVLIPCYSERLDQSYIDSSRPQPHFSQPHFSQPCAARSCMARTRLHPFRECFHTTTKGFNWVFKLMY